MAVLILLFKPSTKPDVKRLVKNRNTPSQWHLMFLATLMTGSSRECVAQK